MKRRRFTIHDGIGLAMFLAVAFLVVKVLTGWP